MKIPDNRSKIASRLVYQFRAGDYKMDNAGETVIGRQPVRTNKEVL